MPTFPEGEAEDSWPRTRIRQVTTYEKSVPPTESKPYDTPILDVTSVRSLDFSDLAVKHALTVSVLTVRAFNPETLKRLYARKAPHLPPRGNLVKSRPPSKIW